MKRMRVLLFIIGTAAVAAVARAVTPEVAELSFDSRWQRGAVTNGLPAWVLGVEQQGGQFRDQPGRWHVEASRPMGFGRLSILLDRSLMQEDLAVTVLYEDNDAADLVVQLFDAQNRVVILDLFSNIVAVGKEARTDTFIVPLRKYPAATRITLRRIRGDIRVYGMVLYPVVGTAEADTETLMELAKLLGDPLSPHSQLVERMEGIARQRDIDLQWRPKARVAISPPPKPAVVPAGSDNEWMALPFPKNSDWPGPKGFAADLGQGFFLLRGQPIRSRRTFSAPVTVSLEAVLEERRADDGGLSILFEPEGVPQDCQGEQAVAVAIVYRNPGAYSGQDGLSVSQRLELTENLRPISKMLWGEEPFTFVAGHPYRIQVIVFADRIRLVIDNRSYDIEAAVPFSRFHVTLQSWQPTNRWHVRNLVVR